MVIKNDRCHSELASRKPSHLATCVSYSATGGDMIIYKQQITKNYDLRRGICNRQCSIGHGWRTTWYVSEYVRDLLMVIKMTDGPNSLVASRAIMQHVYPIVQQVGT
jgi:hypothetical protein